MKKLMVLLLVLGALVFAQPGYAADVVITITIPDAYVARLQAAVLARLPCDGMGAKACLTALWIEEAKQIIWLHEKDTAINTAEKTFNNGYVGPVID